jgi:hypothetical protein
LTELDVNHSLEVTNVSVQPLRNARKLQFLNLEGAKIDDEHYAMILSELPNIANITFRQDESSLLRHIAVERIDTITHVTGSLQDIDTVAHKCPNTSNIFMNHIRVDLPGLTAFNVLRALEIHDLDYGRSNLKAVLQGVGHRLSDLKLSLFEGIVLQDSITLCPSLATLSLFRCSFKNLNSSTQFDPQLPHFRNLIKLEVVNPNGILIVCRLIRYYVSLKTIHFIETRIFTVKVVEDILNLGTYKQLEILHVEECKSNVINIKALQLLIPHCPLLKRIEIVVRSLLGRDVFGEFKRQIVLQNFDLKFKVYYETYPLSFESYPLMLIEHDVS